MEGFLIDSTLLAETENKFGCSYTMITDENIIRTRNIVTTLKISKFYIICNKT